MNRKILKLAEIRPGHKFLESIWSVTSIYYKFDSKVQLQEISYHFDQQ